MRAEMIHHNEGFARHGVKQDGLLVAAEVDDLSHGFSPPSPTGRYGRLLITDLSTGI
jgi:hypothetical protein